jgi:outer membrane protein assembly factor BamB
MLQSARAAMACLASASMLLAQINNGTDWMTSGFDAQRSSWVRTDAKINLASVASKDFQLAWELQLPAASTPPVLLDFYIGYKGFRALGAMGSTNNAITTLDTELGRVEWGSKPTQETRSGCASEMLSAVTRGTNTAYPGNISIRGRGRATPAKSGVGEAMQGAVTIKRNMPPAPPPPRPANTAPQPPAFNPFAPRVQYVHALTGDGMLHSYFISSGKEPQAPKRFLLSGAGAHGLIALSNVLYVGVAGGCSGTADGVHAMELTNGNLHLWKAAGGVAGNMGPAFGGDGTVYATTKQGEVAALTALTLEQKATWKGEGLRFTSTPTLFMHEGQEWLAASASDGRIHVFAANDLAKGPALQSGPAPEAGEPGSLTSWQDAAGARWILAAQGPRIHAYKIGLVAGKPGLQRTWSSDALVNPLPPIVVNGVLFVVAGGEAGRNAVLSAHDALSGKALWTSGSNIAGHVKNGGLSAGGARVYVSTSEGKLYAFGFPIEH